MRSSGVSTSEAHLLLHRRQSLPVIPIQQWFEFGEDALKFGMLTRCAHAPPNGIEFPLGFNDQLLYRRVIPSAHVE